MNYRGLNIPHVSFGAVTSDDLFCEKEQALFDLYEAWGKAKRYRFVLDIGANIGVHSILMARQGWEVWAFEPDTEHFRHLYANVALDQDGSNITFCEAAVSDHEGLEKFVRVKGNTTGSHLKGDKQPYGELEEFIVPVVDCRPLFDWADFAKIDCEGHEARLLLTVEPDCSCDFLVEVGNAKNAEAIWNHFLLTEYWLWAQKSGWAICRDLKDVPKHHSEGALFIGRRAPIIP